VDSLKQDSLQVLKAADELVLNGSEAHSAGADLLKRMEETSGSTNTVLARVGDNVTDFVSKLKGEHLALSDALCASQQQRAEAVQQINLCSKDLISKFKKVTETVNAREHARLASHN